MHIQFVYVQRVCYRVRDAVSYRDIVRYGVPVPLRRGGDRGGNQYGPQRKHGAAVVLTSNRRIATGRSLVCIVCSAALDKPPTFDIFHPQYIPTTLSGSSSKIRVTQSHQEREETHFRDDSQFYPLSTICNPLDIPRFLIKEKCLK